MNIGAKSLSTKRETQAPKVKPSPVKRKINRFWRYIWRRKKVLLDAALFAVAAGTFYFFGEKISQAFIDQLPPESTTRGGPTFSTPEPE